MNRTRINDNALIKRSTSFNLTQREMYRNIEHRDLSSLSTGGVIMSLVGEGLEPNSESLRVNVYDDERVWIGSGFAIEISGNRSRMLVHNDEENIGITDYQDGEFDVRIHYATVNVPTGEEVYAPGKHYDSNSIYLVERDSSAINIGETSGGFILARIVTDAMGHLIPLLTRSLVVDINHGVIESNTPVIQLDNAAGLSVGDTLRIDEEYMEITSISGNMVSVDRGVHNTIPDVHFNGDNVYRERVIDMRQTNAAKINEQDDAFIKRLKKGIIHIDDLTGDRVLTSRRIPSRPNPPSVADISLIWLNQQTTGGVSSAPILEAVATIESSETTVRNISENIKALNSELAQATVEEAPRLQQAIIDNQLSLSSAQQQFQSAKNTLSSYNRTFRTAPRKYVLSILVRQPDLIDNEQIVQYVAMVRYRPIRSSELTKITGIPKFIKSEILEPVGEVNIYGDKDYGLGIGEQPDEIYRSILIPIQPNEAVEVMIKSVSEYGYSSEWVSLERYTFNEYDNEELQLAVALDRIERREYEIDHEFVTQQIMQLVTQLQSRLMAAESSINQHNQLIQALTDRVTKLEEGENDNSVDIARLQASVEHIQEDLTR